jgi:hypothetical protein
MSMGVAVMVVVTAMLVMVMVVAVIMPMVIVMALMMTGVVVGMTMGPTVMRRVGCLRVAITFIGAALGIERSLDLDHPRAQPLHHLLDHVIAPDTQCLPQNLRRQVTIAEMPGNTDQVLRIATADFQQRLGRSDHLDQPAVLEQQCITAAQGGRTLEIEQKFKPSGPGHRHAPAVTIVEIEHDGIGRRFAPAMMRLDLRRADHCKGI